MSTDDPTDGSKSSPSEAQTAVTKVARTTATPLRRHARHPSPEHDVDDGPIPEVPERFEVKRVLGRGGMGVVLEVRDKVLDRDVALKVMDHSRWEDAGWRKRFLREARAAGTLRHPGIVTVHEFSEEGRYIVMELVRGESLSERLRRDGPMSPGEVRRIGRALLDALAAAHAADVIHRDIKPSNVIIDQSAQVRLADFGVASFGDAKLTTTGTQVGTPGYMAPEQLRGRSVDHRADIYSAGATLFEAATGTALHSDDVAKTDPRSLLEVATGDRALARAISGAVQERVTDRWQSAAAFETELCRMTARRGLGARPGRKLVIGLTAVLIVALAYLVYPPWGIMGASNAPPDAHSDARALGDDKTELLQTAISSIEGNKLQAAHQALDTLLERDPTDREANYYIAVLAFWQSEEDAAAAVKYALVGASPEQKDFLESFVVFKTQDYVASMTRFELAAERHPRSRDITYGLFESLYHVGYPTRAMSAYRKVTELSPGFQMGLLHPLTHFAAHGNHAGMEWAVARAQTFGQSGSRLWSMRVHVMRREYAAAETLAKEILAGARGPVTAVERESVKRDVAQILAATGRLDDAEAIADELSDPVALWGLSAARGDADARVRWRDRSLDDAIAGDGFKYGPAVSINIGRAHLQAAVGIAIDHIQLPSEALASKLRKALATPSSLDGSRRMALAGARALIGGVVGDEALLAEGRRSPLPEAAAIAAAFDARLGDDPVVEARAWRTAIEHSVDGRYMLVEKYLLADALRRAGDSAAVLATCDEVIDPHLFLNWSWGAAVGPCLLWSARAAEELGRRADARELYGRLLRLRTAAGKDDPLVAAARAGLAQ